MIRSLLQFARAGKNKPITYRDFYGWVRRVKKPDAKYNFSTFKATPKTFQFTKEGNLRMPILSKDKAEILKARISEFSRTNDIDIEDLPKIITTESGELQLEFPSLSSLRKLGSNDKLKDLVKGDYSLDELKRLRKHAGFEETGEVKELSPKQWEKMRDEYFESLEKDFPDDGSMIQASESRWQKIRRSKTLTHNQEKTVEDLETANKGSEIVLRMLGFLDEKPLSGQSYHGSPEEMSKFFVGALTNQIPAIPELLHTGMISSQSEKRIHNPQTQIWMSLNGQSDYKYNGSSRYYDTDTGLSDVHQKLMLGKSYFLDPDNKQAGPKKQRIKYGLAKIEKLQQAIKSMSDDELIKAFSTEEDVESLLRKTIGEITIVSPQGKEIVLPKFNIKKGLKSNTTKRGNLTSVADTSMNVDYDLWKILTSDMPDMSKLTKEQKASRIRDKIGAARDYIANALWRIDPEAKDSGSISTTVFIEPNEGAQLVIGDAMEYDFTKMRGKISGGDTNVFAMQQFKGQNIPVVVNMDTQIPLGVPSGETRSRYASRQYSTTLANDPAFIDVVNGKPYDSVNRRDLVKINEAGSLTTEVSIDKSTSRYFPQYSFNGAHMFKEGGDIKKLQWRLDKAVKDNKPSYVLEGIENKIKEIRKSQKGDKITKRGKSSVKTVSRTFDLPTVEAETLPVYNASEVVTEGDPSKSPNNDAQQWAEFYSLIQQSEEPVTTSKGLDVSGVDFAHMDSHSLGNGYTLTRAARHKCTSGPGTWLKAMGYDVDEHGGWWTTPYSTSTTQAEFIKNDPTHWKLVYHSTGDKANDFQGMQAGDIALSFATKTNGSATSHAQMYTGTDWRSDFIQNDAWVYGKNAGRNGDQSYQVWRYVPDPVSAKNGGIMRMGYGGETNVFTYARTFDLPSITADNLPIVTTTVHHTTTTDPEETSSEETDWEKFYKAIEDITTKTGPTTTKTDPTTTKTGPRGYRNNNALNIIKSSVQWEGQIANGTDPKFVQFETPEYGYRAGFKNIKTQMGRGNNTLNKLISVWDPAQKTDGSSNYIKSVASAAGIDPNAKLDINDKETMIKVVAAMAKFENGQDANLAEVSAGYDMMKS